ncbi:PR domain zinc finger protein 5-like [Mercenaria mercenaria]|uniref:PR domain zinc finger protein 5-like n=1 Tax=Mercenaria mercenaria TaxID=6596 RepID=UPI00234F0490|nr:PR domain zinc finger protein 5-like [Mercenaria mercenaria]
MQESVNAPRTDINVQIRGGYKNDSRGQWDTKGVSWNCTCVNCGEQFSNRRKLRYHYTKCPFYVDFQQVPENDVAAKDFKCSRCGKKFVDMTRLAFHNEKCGYYIPMHQVDTCDHTVVTDTAKTDSEIAETNDNVIFIGVEDEPDNQEAVVVETEDLNSEKCEQNDGLERTDFATPEINVEADNPSSVNHPEDNDNADSVQIDKHVRESVRIRTEIMKEQLLKTHHRKRKYDIMLSTSSDQSQMVLKKIKSQGEQKVLNKLLIDDMHQEHRQNVFERISSDQRSYKCPKCSVRFKYKHKFDIHVKFAHVQSRSLITATDLKSTKKVSENKCSATGFAESNEATDGSSVLNHYNDGTVKSSSPSENSKVKPRTGHYPCDFCHLSFRYLSRCERHMKSVHKEPEDQLKFGDIFRCVECQERFPDKYALLKHYNRQHMRNANNPTVAEQTIYEQFNSILNVNDVMKHLRNNLTCLQDRKGIEKDHDDEPHLKTTNHFRDSNRSTGIRSSQFEGKIESNDGNISQKDNLENTAYTGTSKSETAARKRTFSVYHYYPKTCENMFTGDYIERKEPFNKKDFQKDKIRSYSPINHNFNDDDKPLDLSTKNCTESEYDTPCDTPEKMTFVDKKPSDSERALLLEYYKDFLQEYCLK